jgi:signal peptidase II
MRKRLFRALPVVVFVFALDQATKYLAAARIDPAGPVEVFPFLHLVNVRNVGAAFGMLEGMGNAFFIIVSVLAIGFILFLMYKGWENPFCLSLILAGALGNLTDRMLLGYVRDFLDFSLGRYHWPAFNVADSALSIGLALIIIGSMRAKKPAGGGEKQV